MAKTHITFEDLGFEDIVDESHLRECSDCHKQWMIFRFLSFQVKHAPSLHLPPFFAHRVAQLTQTASNSLTLSLQKAAQQLLPIFVALIITTSFLFYQLTNSKRIEYGSEILFEPVTEEDFSLEYVVNSLADLPTEDEILEEPR